MNYYAVAKGREVGIFSTWAECKAQVEGYKNAKYKKFTTTEDAFNFINSIPIPLHNNPCKNIDIDDSLNSHHHKNHATPIVVYTDGSCLGNNGRGLARAGVGIYFGPDDIRNVSHAVPRTEVQTNQRAELMAAVEALELIDKEAIDSTIVELRTDSKWVINGVQLGWISNWKRNGWKTSSRVPVLHQDLWTRLDHVLSRLNVNFVHVKGHSGEVGNEAVDLLAKKGALMD